MLKKISGVLILSLLVAALWIPWTQWTGDWLQAKAKALAPVSAERAITVEAINFEFMMNFLWNETDFFSTYPVIVALGCDPLAVQLASVSRLFGFGSSMTEL
jgi:hypothetical protein